MKYFNSNLITLKCVLFLFFGAIGALFPFLPSDLNKKNFTYDESRTISAVAPIVALLGPAIAAPLADRLAMSSNGSRSKTGAYLRIMTAVCFILSTIFYWLLMIVPTVVKNPPAVAFMCDPNGGVVLQDRCGVEKTCFNWDNTKQGALYLNNCVFACKQTSFDSIFGSTTPNPELETNESEYDSDYTESDAIVSGDGPIETPDFINPVVAPNMSAIPHPHICSGADGMRNCEVYTEFSKPIQMKISLNPSTAQSDDRVCSYAIAGDFSCRITPDVIQNLTEHSTNSCEPIIKCNVYEPYNASDSILIESQCGYNNMSFWFYLIIRSLADIFPAAAVALLGAAIIIATRETSTGRGDVGKQFAAGALGFAIFAPIAGGINQLVAALVIFTILMLLGAAILLMDNKMPLSPPEWWWHTRCGLLAMPMSVIKKYGLETAALTTILFLLGIFWSALDSYLPWIVVLLEGTQLMIGFTIMIGALLAIPFFIFAERIVDFCGHTNLLITSFTIYIIHFIGVTCSHKVWQLILCEALEIFSLHIMWITAVLYFRHLVPRKLTATGQAIPVMAHFCLGRCIGALIGGIAYSGSKDSFMTVHFYLTIAAAVVAILYFIIYHFFIKPYCVTPNAEPPKSPPALIQSMNGNGSYTPLRVYHNGRAKKGQFRY